MPHVTQRITPFLWFDDQAEEAAMLGMKKLDIAGLRRAHEGP
jgi:predicted 3-demethylubiquinone-9 3-methyltransferase (glyoxalase superfamily)